MRLAATDMDLEERTVAGNDECRIGFDRQFEWAHLGVGGPTRAARSGRMRQADRASAIAADWDMQIPQLETRRDNHRFCAKRRNGDRR